MADAAVIPLPRSSDPRRVRLRARGTTGLQQTNGIIREQYISELNGQEAIRVYKRIGDYDPVGGAVLYSMDKVLRQVPWKVEPASSYPGDVEAANYLETCMHDMNVPWPDTIAEIFSMAQYGHSLHEKCYKRRLGPDQTDKAFRSKYKDGRIGWRGLPIRAQDTITRWLFDDAGEILGAEQVAPPSLKTITLPIETCILFRTSVHKNSPEGRSIFMSAYESWYAKRNIQAIEAIGIERDLAGLPVGWCPPDYLGKDAPINKRMVADRIEQICANVRNDEMASVVMPLSFDANGNKQFDFTLLNSGGARAFNTDTIVQRYDHRIAISAMADFVLMGQASSTTGSLAMHSDKTNLFIMGIMSFLDIIAKTLQPAIDELFALNAASFDISDTPRLAFGDASQVDLGVMGEYLNKLAQAGMQMFPNATLEAHLLDIAKLPKPAEYESAGAIIAEADDDGEVNDEDAPEPIIPAGVNESSPQVPASDSKAGPAVADASIATDPGEDTPINQKTLAGAQIAQVAAIVKQVADGELPRDSARAILTLAFPISDADAEKVLGSAGTSFRTTPDTAQNAPT